MCAPPRTSVVNASFGVSVAASLAARRCLVVLERVEAIALAFPVEKHGEASLGLARRRLERRKFKLAGPFHPTRRAIRRRSHRASSAPDCTTAGTNSVDRPSGRGEHHDEQNEHDDERGT